MPICRARCDSLIALLPRQDPITMKYMTLAPGLPPLSRLGLFAETATEA
ncbi:MAG: hypothetical protein ACREFB_18485 [Stellaceae bacterium]